MSQRGLRRLPDEAREALRGLVAKRMEAPAEVESFDPIPARDYAAMTDFTTLPSFNDLKFARSAGELTGVGNPFFRTHEARAGARTVIGGQIYDNFSSYDYLGLNGHPAVAAAAKSAIDAYGVSPSASRLVAGERPVHGALERALADHYEQEACAVFVSGHATNVATIGTLMGPRDLIVHDALSHNSVIVGATLSGAERRPFPHGDLKALDDLLTSIRHQFQRVMIIVEGLYSMDGDVADLATLIQLKRRHGAWLLVDDAHGLGVLGRTGRGLFEHCGVDPRGVDIWMGTLSKTLSSCGGYIAGCADLVEYLKCLAGGFVYSVGLAPALAASATAALAVMHREPERVDRLRRNSSLFLELAKAEGLDIGTSCGAAIIPVICHDSFVAVALSQRLFEHGINVQPIIHPAVPERTARLRFFVSSEHDEDQVRRTVARVAEDLNSLRRAPPALKRRR
jgi:8-amino-7-oxononanoate synthase